jgi:UDP-N-acetylmuramate: L-alanyl-gamma-D-glutamyl-meso-diaminopimelate ligase
VVEGDEYDSAFFEKHAKFLSYEPEGLILTSMEHDHVDIYPTWSSYRIAFTRLVTGMTRAGCLVACADHEHVRDAAQRCQARTLTYSVSDARADYRAVDMEQDGLETRFTVLGPEGDLGRFDVPLTGAHNASNALAALVLAREHSGVGIEELRSALPTFPGVARRQDRVGSAGGVEVLDDFGHHPTAIEATLDGLRSRGRLLAVLRPASATGCRNLHQEGYAAALARADVTVLAPLARTDIPAGERLDLERLARDIGDAGSRARLAATLEAVPAEVAAEAREGDTVVFFSNTDPVTLIRDTLRLLGDRALR